MRSLRWIMDDGSSMVRRWMHDHRVSICVSMCVGGRGDLLGVGGVELRLGVGWNKDGVLGEREAREGKAAGREEAGVGRSCSSSLTGRAGGGGGWSGGWSGGCGCCDLLLLLLLLLQEHKVGLLLGKLLLGEVLLLLLRELLLRVGLGRVTLLRVGLLGVTLGRVGLGRVGLRGVGLGRRVCGHGRDDGLWGDVGHGGHGRHGSGSVAASLDQGEQHLVDVL